MKNVLSMNDAQISPAVSSETVVSISAGQALQQAREAAGLHIAALASMLKVPVKKLEALEENRFDLLPDAVFIRALAASVCRTLKIDAAPILALLPMTPSSTLAFPRVGINENFRSPGDAPGLSMWAQLSRPAILAGLVFLFGALVLVFLPAIKMGFHDLKTAVADFSLGSSANKSATKSVETAVQPTSSAEAVDSVAKMGTSPAQALPSGVDAGRAQNSLSITTSISSPVSSSTGVNAGALTAPDIVVFTSTGESWVEATDAKGQVVLRRNLMAGEVVSAAGLLPLKVVVGRANVTQVQIRGESFDLSPVSRDNVARFEVK